MIKKFKLKKNKNKKKKGFTLVELLAVIVILAIIMIITIPTVIGSMNNAKLKAEEIFIASIERSLNKFIENELQYSDYTFETPKKEYVTEDIANKYRVSKVLINDGVNKKTITFNDFDELGYYPSSDLVNPNDTENTCDTNTEIEIYKNKSKNEYYYYTDLNCIDVTLSNLPPEEPDLSGDLIPVVLNSGKWVVADPTSDYYNYDNQEWANAVLIKNSNIDSYKSESNKFNDGVEINSSHLLAMFVWIPRFSYTIGCTDGNCYGYKIEGASDLTKATPGAIDIKFIPRGVKEELVSGIDKPTYNYDSSNKRIPTNWLTHPAFEFDNQQLSGIWVGKYETSYGYSPSGYYIKESATPEKSNNIKYYFDSAKNFNTGLNSHLIKNSEWGAVSYLSQSKYGKYGNSLYSGADKEVKPNTFNSTGGGGNQASTTGNKYGVFDMVAGSYGYQEFVAAVYTGTNKSSYSGFTNVEINNNKNYIDLLSFQPFNDSGYLGHATSETKYWYNDNPTNLNTSNSGWLVRGYYNSSNLSYSGIFNGKESMGNNANNTAFRIVLSIKH